MISLSFIGSMFFFIGLLNDIILHATGLWYYNSLSKPVLNKFLAKKESASENNFAASPHVKQNNLRTPAAWDVLVLGPLVLLQPLTSSFK